VPLDDVPAKADVRKQVVDALLITAIAEGAVCRVFEPRLRLQVAAISQAEGVVEAALPAVTESANVRRLDRIVSIAEPRPR
jgi:hypothetical protein